MNTRGRSMTVSNDKAASKKRATTAGPSSTAEDPNNNNAPRVTTLKELKSAPGPELPDLELEEPLPKEAINLLSDLKFDLSASPLYKSEQHPKNTEILSFKDFTRRFESSASRARLLIYLYEHWSGIDDAADSLTRIRGEREHLRQIGKEQETQIKELTQDVADRDQEIARLHTQIRQGTHDTNGGFDQRNREGTIDSQGTVADQGSRKMITSDVDKLTSATPEHFIHFRDNIIDKINIEASYFRGDNRLTIRYIQSRLDTDIASMMRPYVNMQGYTANKFIDRLGKSCGMDNAARKARIDLTKITQKADESIDAYHARIASLWNIASTSEEERVETLRTTVNRTLAFSIVANSYETVDELLDALRSIESRHGEIRAIHPRNRDKPQSTFPTNNSRRTSASTSNSDRRISNPNAALTPTATKPQGWTGPWFKPETNPKSLAGDFQARTKLSEQNRCYRCRGSGHRATDPCCPLKNKPTKFNSVEIKSEPPESNDPFEHSDSENSLSRG